MKIAAIQTSNFLGARDVDVKLNKPVAVFAGPNAAGKSSLQEAIRMAFVGESVRVGLKKEYGALITEGQESGFVQVDTADSQYSIVLPSGKGVHADHDALPFVLNAQRFAGLSQSDRREFLFGLMGLSIGAAKIGERLLARGCDAKKVDQAVPLLRAGFEAAQKEAAAKARDAKTSWKTTTGGETYGSNKAASWKATKPAIEVGALEQAKADLQVIEDEIEKETARLGEMQSLARLAADQAGKLADLREKAGRAQRIAEKLERDEAELKHWGEKLEETRKRASGTAELPRALQCPCCNAKLMHQPADGGLVEYSAPEAKADPQAVAALPEYERALKMLQNAVANGKRDLAVANSADATLREIEGGNFAEAPDEAAVAALKTRIDGLKQSRVNQRAAITQLENAARQSQEADEKTARAAALHQDVQQWEVIADALAPNGIPGEILAEALGPINERLVSASVSSGWARIGIEADMSITEETGNGGRPYALLSESEKWRADAMIAEAISYISEARILVLDRFDVLDLTGREQLLYWLDDLAYDSEIDTALIFGTLKALPAQLPESAAAFWIENGTTAQLREAA